MSRRLLAATAALAAALVAGASSCSTAGDGQLRQIDSADLFGLDQTTTSTTSTTTIPPPLPPPPTVSPTLAATSTTVASEPVTLYFVDGTHLADVSIDLARSPSPSRVVTALLAGPPSGDVGIGLRSKLPDDLVNTVLESGTGYVTVDLNGDAFERIDPADQRIAFGQLVLTLTRRPGIGQVRFTRDGESARVVRGDNLQTAAGETVSAADYVSLLGAVETTTTVVPVATTTVDPPEQSPPATDGQ